MDVKETSKRKEKGKGKKIHRSQARRRKSYEERHDIFPILIHALDQRTQYNMKPTDREPHAPLASSLSAPLLEEIDLQISASLERMCQHRKLAGVVFLRPAFHRA